MAVGMQRADQKYSYLTHPNNLPLQLTGSSKRKVTSIKKTDFGQQQCSLHDQSRSLLLKKLSKSKYDIQNAKSILPASDRRASQKASSIRTFKENKQNMRSSGIEYLMQKTEGSQPKTHKQRAHLKERFAQPSKNVSKKHFIQQSVQGCVQELKRPFRHKQTQKVKLAHDIYSNVYRAQKQPVVAKKLQLNNLFKRGEQLGFQQKRQKKCSDLKMIEMVGCQHVRELKGGLRERRQDWRTSNVTFF